MRLHTGALKRGFARLFTRIAPALAISFMLALTSTLSAEPSLHVRAGTRLELHAQRDGNVARIEGVLLDDLDAPLAGQSIRLTLQPTADEPNATPEPVWSRTVRSDSGGRFVHTLNLRTRRYVLAATYAGDALHEGAQLEEPFDVALADVQLQIALPGGREISLDDPHLIVEVRASSDAGVEGLTITLQDETARVLAQGVPDAQGVWRTEVASAAIGDPGSGQLLASSAADAQRAAARAATAVLRLRGTQLTLQAVWDEGRERLQLQGALRTQVARLAGKAVGLFLDGEHALTVVTDAHGHFVETLSAARDSRERFGQGTHSGGQTHHVSARFDSDAPGLRSSRSVEQPVTIPAWSGPNLLWVILPSLASLLLIGLLLRRSGTWLGAAPSAEVFEAGVQLGATRQRNAPSLRDIDGVIEDADSATPLGRASLGLKRADAPGLSAQVGADGSFAISGLEPGLYRVEARAPGYALERSELWIPHAGEGSGLRVRLRSLRALALEAHRPVVRRVFATRELQHSATPREALRHGGSLLSPPEPTPPLDSAVAPPLAAPDPLEDLTLLVEQTAYSSDTPTVEHVQAIERATHELLKRSV